jgi:hypothetical protein
VILSGFAYRCTSPSPVGAVVVRIEPDVFLYAATSAGMLTMLLFAISFLIPVAYLVEWTLRPLFE